MFYDQFLVLCSSQVNSEVVTLPLLREPYIYVERQTNTILLNTNIGLKVCGLSFLCGSYLQSTASSSHSHTLPATSRFCGADARTWR